MVLFVFKKEQMELKAVKDSRSTRIEFTRQFRDGTGSKVQRDTRAV